MRAITNDAALPMRVKPSTSFSAPLARVVRAKSALVALKREPLAPVAPAPLPDTGGDKPVSGEARGGDANSPEVVPSPFALPFASSPFMVPTMKETIEAHHV